MKYAVMFEPFDELEYVCKPKSVIDPFGRELLLFDKKWMAQLEADKWNTGIVVEYMENNTCP
jgi:hypothetical protein|tara:strand:+ start:742 stop:927 length:186 start_codon:yes stop_codon:yes gene_type:complete